MKSSALLVALFPLIAFSQYDEELGYIPPDYALDSTKPVLHTPTLSLGLTYSDRFIRTNPVTTFFESDKYLHDERMRIHSFYATGFRIGYAYTIDRFYFPTTFGLQYFRLHYSRDLTISEWNDEEHETTRTASESWALLTRVSFSTGIGFQLFKPTSKFNLIPLVSAAPTFSFHDSKENDQRHSVIDYSYHSSTLDSISHVDTNFNYRQRGTQANLDLTAGLIVSYRFSKNFSAQAQYMHGFFSNGFFEGDEQMGNYICASICYHLPEKVAYRRLKEEKIEKTDSNTEEEAH